MFAPVVKELFADEIVLLKEASKISDDPLRQFCCSVYNDLLSVEMADVSLSRSGKLDAFLADARKVTASYDSIDFLSVRLAHKHSILADGDIMLEEFKYDQGEPAFITSNKSGTIKGSSPASWIKTSDGFRVFEYSTDAAVFSGFQYLAEHPNVLRNLEDLLQKYCLESYLAPAITKLDSLTNFEPAQHLVEKSRMIVKEDGTEIHENVVKAVCDSVYSQMDVIRTSWSIDCEEMDPLYCWRNCATGPQGQHDTSHVQC